MKAWVRDEERIVKGLSKYTGGHNRTVHVYAAQELYRLASIVTGLARSDVLAPQSWLDAY